MTATLTEPRTHVEPDSGRPAVIESFNPATGEKLGEARIWSPEEVAEAAAKGREAQKGWAALGADGRNRILKNLQRVMIRRADEIVSTINRENGKPRSEAATMIVSVSEAIDFYTGIARRYRNGKKVSPTKLFWPAKTKIYYEPRGLCGFIMPWNFPFELGMKHMVPALAAGNAVLQKPSEFNPLIGDLILSLYREAGVPEGVVQVVHGYADVGLAVIDNSDTITFIGSPNTGRKIMARAAERLIPVILELGGNDAAIVREDADLDRAAKGIVSGAMLNAGQTCVSVERVYVHERVAEKFTQKVLERVAKLRQACDGETYDVGPIKWARQRRIYEEHMKDAVAKGAKVLAGGECVEKDGGLFWKPTVLTDMNHDMEMMKEETFGPFLPIMKFKDDEEALRLANDSPYGLGGSVWTSDLGKGEEMARRVQSGSVMLNNALVSAGCPTLPFGGNRFSGVGRAFGEEGYLAYTSPRSFMRGVPGKMGELGWMPYGKDDDQFMIALAKVLYGSVGDKIQGMKGVAKKLLKG